MENKEEKEKKKGIFNKIKGHYQTFMMVMVVLIFSGYVPVAVRAAFPKAASMTDEVLENAIGGMMDERLAPVVQSQSELQESLTRVEAQLSADNNYAVLFMEFELNEFTTAEEAYAEMDEWLEKKWGSQLNAMRAVSRDPASLNALQDLIFEEEVFEAFMRRSRGY